MTPYKQRNYPDQLGTCNTTIAREGCAITACGILANTSPPDVNRLGCYLNGCLANWECLANKLNLDYESRRDVAVKYPCIAEVVLSGFQHFIVLKDENTQIDPWTGQEGKLSYQVLSYRNLTPKNNQGGQVDCQSVVDNYETMMHHSDRNVSNTMRTDILGKAEEKDIEADAQYMKADSGSSYNHKGTGTWLHGFNRDVILPKIKEGGTQVATLQKSLDDTTVALQTAKETIATLNKRIKERDDEIDACNTNLMIATGQLKGKIDPSECPKEEKQTFWEWFRNYFTKE